MLRDALQYTNLVAAALNLAVATFVLAELVRLRAQWSRLAIVLVLFFVGRSAERLSAPDPLLGYNAVVDAAIDGLLIVLLLLLVLDSRRLARTLLVTYAEARFRVGEYERALKDYERLVRHRIMNPLTAIRGAAEALATDAGEDPATRQQLCSLIVEASQTLEQTTLEPELRRREEKRLRPIPGDFERPTPPRGSA